MASLSTILSWFKTGLKPTENQFAQAWSSFYNKEESIPQNAITGLPLALATISSGVQQIDTIILEETGVYIIPAGKMITLLVIETLATQSLSIGSAEGLSDILDETEIAGPTPHAIRIDVVANTSASKTLYLHGFTSPLKIHIHKINYL